MFVARETTGKNKLYADVMRVHRSIERIYNTADEIVRRSGRLFGPRRSIASMYGTELNLNPVFRILLKSLPYTGNDAKMVKFLKDIVGLQKVLLRKKTTTALLVEKMILDQWLKGIRLVQMLTLNMGLPHHIRKFLDPPMRRQMAALAVKRKYIRRPKV